MTYTMRRPTPDERDKITRCRRQFFEVERLGLLKEQVETLLPARLNDGMPRGSPMPYGIDDKMIRAERTRREYDEAVKLLEVSGIPQEVLKKEKAEVYEQLSEVNRKIRAEREKLKLCREICQQTPVMEQDIQKTEEHQKEVREHEHRRR